VVPVTSQLPRTPQSREVLRAFGATGESELLAGGFHRRGWRCGSVGLKPVDLPADSLHWQADLLDRVDGRDDICVAVRDCPHPTGILMSGNQKSHWATSSGR
jgi:hypothetical protein